MATPPSSIAGANRDSTSSSLLPHKTLVHEITAPTEPAVEVKNDGSAAKEMATYQIRLGDAYMNLGDYERARSCFSRALGLAPDNKAALDKVRRADRARAAEESVLR